MTFILLLSPPYTLLTSSRPRQRSTLASPLRSPPDSPPLLDVGRRKMSFAFVVALQIEFIAHFTANLRSSGHHILDSIQLTAWWAAQTTTMCESSVWTGCLRWEIDSRYLVGLGLWRKVIANRNCAFRRTRRGKEMPQKMPMLKWWVYEERQSNACCCCVLLPCPQLLTMMHL